MAGTTTILLVRFQVNRKEILSTQQTRVANGKGLLLAAATWHLKCTRTTNKLILGQKKWFRFRLRADKIVYSERNVPLKKASLQKNDDLSRHASYPVLHVAQPVMKHGAMVLISSTYVDIATNSCTISWKVESKR